MSQRCLTGNQQSDSLPVKLVNNFAEQAGLLYLPAVPKRLVHQYTSKDLESLNVEREWGVSSFDVGTFRDSKNR